MDFSTALSKLTLEWGPVPAHPPLPIPVAPSPLPPAVSDSASIDVALLPPPIEIQQASSRVTAAAAVPDKKKLPVLVHAVMAARAFKRAAPSPIPVATPAFSLPVPLPPRSRPTTLVPPRQQPHAAVEASASSSMPTLARILRDRQGSSGLEDGPAQTPAEAAVAVPAPHPSALALVPDGASPALPSALPSIPPSTPLLALEASVSGSGGTASSARPAAGRRSSSEECIECASTLADVRRAAAVAAPTEAPATTTAASASASVPSLLTPALALKPSPRRPEAFNSVARRPLLPQTTNGGGGVPSPRSLGARAVLEPLSPSTGGTTNGGAPGSLPPLRSLPYPASTLLAPALDSPRMPPPSAALPLGQPL